MTDAADNTAYLSPPEMIGKPDELHLPGTRAFQGIPSLAVSPDGHLRAVWYAGKTPAEDYNNYIVFAGSRGCASAWEEYLIIDPDGEGPVRAFDPEIWFAPDGRLWLFWAQGLDAPFKFGPSGVWAVSGTDADSGNIEWSKPRRLCDGVMMCKPLVLSGGEWALPVSFWHRRDRGSAGIVVSEDRGETWYERGACDVPPGERDHDEHMLVELKDGSLWMLVRTTYGIGESRSSDSGRTWSGLRPAGIEHPASRFFIRRLNSGNLLLVKHGPIQKRTGRSHLTACLSGDEGASWMGGLVLDERDGVSYPDGQQAQDGTIYIIYDRARTGDRDILLAAFTEDDVSAGKIISAAPGLKMKAG